MTVYEEEQPMRVKTLSHAEHIQHFQSLSTRLLVGTNIPRNYTNIPSLCEDISPLNSFAKSLVSFEDKSTSVKSK